MEIKTKWAGNFINFMGKYDTISTPKAAWQKISRLRKKRRIPELESLILLDPNASYNYAKTIINGRWPAAEPIILEQGSAKILFYYARHVMNSRWKEAEEKILKDSKYILEYTKDVIGGRWPEAEETLISNFWKQENENPFIEQKDYFWDFELLKYASSFVNDRWIEIEEIISKNPIALNSYAKEILQDRLPDHLHNMMTAYSLQYDQDRDRKKIAILEYFDFVETNKKLLKKIIKNRTSDINITVDEFLKTLD